MEMLQKFVIYVLIISSGVDYTWGKPAGSADMHKMANVERQGDANLSGNEHVARDQRQVVQPTWLQWGGGNVFADSKVHVTQQSLKEAAAIRESIQKAIQDGHFAVNPDDQSNAPPLPLHAAPEHASALTTPLPHTVPNPSPPSPQQPDTNQFMADMQSLWFEFLKNARRWFS